MFLVYLDGLEHFLLEILENGPFVPKSTASTPGNFLTKPQKQWIATNRKLANQDKRLKSIIISYLPNDTMKVVIKCSTAREMWNDLILNHEGPSKIRDTKIASLRLKSNASKALKGDKDVEEETKSNNEGVTRVKAFMAIAEDEQVVGKTDVGQTSIKVTLYQLLTEQVPGNIVRALGGRGKLKETIPSKGVLFTKGENSPSKTSPDVTSDTKFVNDNQQSLPPLPKLSGAEPVGTSNDVISHVDLIPIFMLSDNTKHITKKELIIMYVKKKSKTKTPSILDASPEKKANSSTKKLLLTMMKEVKSLKEHIKPLLDNSSFVSQTGSSKFGKGKQKAKIEPCKTPIPLTNCCKEDPNQLKAQKPQATSSRKALKIPKPFIPCKYCGFIDHHSDDYKYYLGCDICGSIAHELSDRAKRVTHNNRRPRIANQ
ncbi:hypothetical protein Tco_0793174 [Tanacetum coccineum]